MPVPTPLARAFSEPLEQRLLLSASTDLTNLKTGPLAKIGDTLANSFIHYLAHPSAAIAPIALQAFSKTTGAALAQSLRQMGATNVQSDATSASAAIPVRSLGQLALLPTLRFAQPAIYITSAAGIAGQSDIADRTNLARNIYGLTGAGVKVGILSDSFNTSSNPDTYADDILSGDLPAGVQILNDSPGGTDEGRAMAQVLYDSAPGVTFAFDTAGNTPAVFAQHIRDLANAGAKVIVDDVTYLNEPMFEDGVIAKAVESVIASGVSYFSAAGDGAEQSYAGTWQSGNTRADSSISSAQDAPHFYGGITYNFGTPSNVNDLESFTLAPNQKILISFQWDSPYFSATGTVGSPNDLDAYVLNADGSQIVGGAATNNINGDPTEIFQFTNTTGAAAKFNLMFAWNNAEGGPQPGYIKYIDFSGQATNWSAENNAGTLFGHANALGNESVAAVSYTNTPAFGGTPVVEPFSSYGSTPIFFAATGARMFMGVTRTNPTITAADNIDNTFFGQDTDGNGLANFTGTSAAAPAAAAIAALLLQKNPALTSAQVANAINSTASFIYDPNESVFTHYNFLAGFGLVRADAAIASIVGTVTGTVYSDNNDNTTLNNGETGIPNVTVYYDANNNNSLDPGETSTITGPSGNFTLTHVNAGSDLIRAVVPAGFVATAASQTVNLPGAGSFSNLNLGLYPTTFTSTTGGASYTLQQDPNNSANLDVIGPLATYVAPRSISATLTFALTGGNNILTVNYANGNPLPSSGINYIGGPTGASNGNVLLVTGSNNADTINIQNFFVFPLNGAISVANVPTIIVNTNGGNDSLTLGESLLSTITIDGGSGSNTLTYIGSGTTENMSVGSATLSNDSSHVSYSNIQTLNVTAPGFQSTTNVNLTTAVLVVSITTSSSNETINLLTNTQNSPVAVIGTGGVDNLVISSTWTGAVNFKGGPNNEVLTFNGTITTNNITVTGTTVSDSATTVTYANLNVLAINGVGTNNTITISSAPSSSIKTTINGGPNTNALIINSALPSNGTTVTFNGGTASTNINTLTINAGIYTLTGDPQTTSANLTVNDNASLIFTAATAKTGINPRHLAALNLGPSATATATSAAAHTDRSVLVLGALSVATNAKLDLNDNDLIVHNGNLTTLNGYLKTAYAARAWTGPGIASTLAGATHKTALGILPNTTGSAPLYTTFDNQPTTLTDILIKYTYYGDADLSGKVDTNDYTRTNAGFTAHTTGWSNGDFNYDNLINGTDYTLLDTAFNSQLPAL